MAIERYVLCMKNFKFLLLISGLVDESWGQQPFIHAAIDPATPTQQRADLRSVLKLVHVQEARVKKPAMESGSDKLDKRQLTPQERANLRQQLRQHYHQAKLERP